MSLQLLFKLVHPFWAIPGFSTFALLTRWSHRNFLRREDYAVCFINSIPDCRARMFHLALDRPLLPFKFDKPPLPTPLFKLPNASQKPRTIHCIARFFILHCNIGALPLCAAYAAHSPRFPFGESRARMNHHAIDRPWLPLKSDKPPAPTPLAKWPNASHSRVPVLAACI